METLRLILYRRTLLVILVAIAAIALVACDGDDDDVEALKIGFLADFSGPLAEFGPEIQTGVELAIKHINDAGGVNGKDVTFVTGDTQVDATQGVEEARRLVEIEGVHAIVGPLSSTVTIAVAERERDRRCGHPDDLTVGDIPGGHNRERQRLPVPEHGLGRRAGRGPGAARL